MNSNQTTHVGQSVALESGTQLMRGTVTRDSGSSIWATFEEDGRTYRFVRSQDGCFRQHGSSSDPRAAVLLFTGDPDAGDSPVNRVPVVETPDLRDASLSLLAQVAQSREIAALLELATTLVNRNDEAQRFGENDAVAVESIMGHLRMAVEAAQRGQRR